MNGSLWSSTWWYEFLRTPRMFLQLFTATLLFTWGLPRRRHFSLRLLGFLGIALVLMFAEGWFLSASVIHDYFSGAVMAALCGACICLCWKASPATTCLIMGNGNLAFGIASGLKIILSTAFPVLEASALSPIKMLLVDFLYCGIVFGGIFLALKDRFRSVDPLANSQKTILCLLSVFANQSIMSLRVGTAGIQSPSIAHYVYLISVSVLILVIQFSFARQMQLSRDVDTMKELTRQQHLQIQTSKENAQLLNEKYHDLKQMIGALRGRPGLDLDALEDSVSGYAAPVHTGNEILDVLLTEKRMICEKEKVAITSMVGGANLSFVSELDLYALFSNALTNAIEAVVTLPPEYARFINLNVSRNGNATVIHMENPCMNEVEFENGLPISHRDHRYHGFGMQSMERTAEKYGGSVAASQQNGMFFVDIILFDSGN